MTGIPMTLLWRCVAIFILLCGFSSASWVKGSRGIGYKVKGGFICKITCRRNVDYVCGNNGKTYINRCLAGCDKVEVEHAGKCGSLRPTLHPTSALPLPVSCPGVYDLVCGSDGNTYLNPCSAKREDVRVVSQGKCVTLPPPIKCKCPTLFKPVCGVDGKTYSNRCSATQCHNVEVSSEGRCVKLPPPDQCVCFAVFKPVCGVDGKTYSNQCSATCRRMSVAHKGACRKLPPPNTCKCITLFAPVCGVNGKTYPNDCFARCAGAEVKSQGVCGPSREDK